MTPVFWTQHVEAELARLASTQAKLARLSDLIDAAKASRADGYGPAEQDLAWAMRLFTRLFNDQRRAAA